MKQTHTGGSVCVCAATTTNAPDFTFLQFENKTNDKRKGWKRISNDGSQVVDCVGDAWISGHANKDWTKVKKCCSSCSVGQTAVWQRSERRESWTKVAHFSCWCSKRIRKERRMEEGKEGKKEIGKGKEVRKGEGGKKRKKADNGRKGRKKTKEERGLGKRQEGRENGWRKERKGRRKGNEST